MRAMSEEASKPETLSAIPDDLKDALAKNTLTDAQMREVANAARQGKDALRKTLSKLSAAGLIDPKSLAKHDQLAQSADKADLAKYLKDHAAEQGWGAALGQYMAGRGGRDRGRGDAAMFFGEKADDKGTKWDEKTLPPATAAGLQNSTKVGVSAAVPDAAHPITSSGGALASATAGGGSAYTSVVLPRHRGAVKRYFERK